MWLAEQIERLNAKLTGFFRVRRIFKQHDGRMRLFLVAVLFSATSAIAANDPALVGSWKVRASITQGEKINPANLERVYREFAHTEILTWGQSGKRTSAFYTLDMSTYPRRIDITFVEDGRRQSTLHGIYEIIGTQLRICLATDPAAEAPVKFVSDRTSHTTLTTYQRIPNIPRILTRAPKTSMIEAKSHVVQALDFFAVAAQLPKSSAVQGIGEVKIGTSNFDNFVRSTKQKVKEVMARRGWAVTEEGGMQSYFGAYFILRGVDSDQMIREYVFMFYTEGMDTVSVAFNQTAEAARW